MRGELFDTHLCKSDFEKYDLKSLEQTCEPFFWCVRDSGTSLVFIGPSMMRSYMELQSRRFFWFRDEYAPIFGIMYWKEPGCKHFFYDGHALLKIQHEDYAKIFKNIWEAEYKSLIQQFKEEYDMRHKPLEIRMPESIKKVYNDTVQFAKSLGDTSLVDCIHRLSHYQRRGIDHCIEVYGDFAKHSFGFCEKLNGEPRIAGGIIYSDYRNEKRWSIHT